MLVNLRQHYIFFNDLTLLLSTCKSIGYLVLSFFFLPIVSIADKNG